jgi:alkylation response protein AidB-like acyl-CoA dehydrogenase
MDVRLSAEQQALADSVAHVIDDLGPRTVQQLDDDERRNKLEAAIRAAGWRELRSAQDDGSPLASGVEVAIVAEGLGRGLADVALLGPTLAAELRRLAEASSSTSAETVLLSHDLSTIASTEDGQLPPGTIAIDADRAEFALAVASTPGGHQLVTVPVQCIEERIDLTQWTGAPIPGSVPAPVAEQGRELDADAMTQWTALGLTITSADLVGVMDGAVKVACEYARERRQYGVPVGSFQAVQHLLADAFVAMEGSRSLTLYAAWALDALGPDDALAAAATAKAYAARAARSVCETVIQVHGGIGNTWECMAHVYLRRALASTEVHGGVGPNLARVLAHAQLSDGNGGNDGFR